jgi:peptidoglycan/LPS O-acetylase OafA/YrhL
MTNNNILTKAECSALRGIAIIGIILHNYCHWLPFTIKENEYTYHGYYNHYFWEHLFDFNSNIEFDFFSYFGHYGVPIFLFISGYGLALKYESSDKNVGIMPFIKYHYLKLFRLMLIGLICYLLIDWILKEESKFTIIGFIAQLTMVINFFPDPDKLIMPGPYWYFGLTFQLYAIYRLIMYRRHWSIIVLLIIVCWIPQMLCDKTSDTLNWLRYNFIGSVLPFGLGILTARYLHVVISDKRIHILLYSGIAIISAIALYFFCDDFMLWLWIPIIILTLSISIIKLTPSLVLKPFEWAGGLSAMIFVIHPILRPIFLPLSDSGWLYTGEILYFVSTLLLAYLYKLLIRQIPSPKLKFKQ